MPGQGDVDDAGRRGRRCGTLGGASGEGGIPESGPHEL